MLFDMLGFYPMKMSLLLYPILPLFFLLSLPFFQPTSLTPTLSFPQAFALSSASC